MTVFSFEPRQSYFNIFSYYILYVLFKQYGMLLFNWRKEHREERKKEEKWMVEEMTTSLIEHS